MACGCMKVVSIWQTNVYIKNLEKVFSLNQEMVRFKSKNREDILSMNEHQIKEIKDHAYQTGKDRCKMIFQNLVDI